MVSPQLLAECIETVEELAPRYLESRRVAWVEAFTASSDLVFPTDRARGATPDPDDEMVVECALAAEASFIVSGERRHLLALREFREIRIVLCAALLSLLLPGA